MTRHVSTTELKAKLSEILGDVERGEVVGVTRHGRTIARITPEPAIDAREVAKAIEEMRSLRKNRPKTGITIDEILAWRHDGHRY
jgi:prevent-host-death family protein